MVPHFIRGHVVTVIRGTFGRIDRKNARVIPIPRDGSRISFKGFYLYKCTHSVRGIFEAVPTLSKPHPFSCVFAILPVVRASYNSYRSVDLKSLPKVSVSTFKHNSTSFK